MYIWAAIDIEQQLVKQKEIVKNIEKEIHFVQSNVSLLPLHVSLKISSKVQDSDEENLRKDIEVLYRNIRPFEIEVDKIEINETIVWIKMKENDNLRHLHDELCTIYLKYGIELHEFDKCFAYHSTLFLDSDKEKISDAFEQIRDIKLPKILIANRFIIGSSPEGKIGTYSVDKTIEQSL